MVLVLALLCNPLTADSVKSIDLERIAQWYQQNKIQTIRTVQIRAQMFLNLQNLIDGAVKYRRHRHVERLQRKADALRSLFVTYQADMADRFFDIAERFANDEDPFLKKESTDWFVMGAWVSELPTEEYITWLAHEDRIFPFNPALTLYHESLSRE